MQIVLSPFMCLMENRLGDSIEYGVGHLLTGASLTVHAELYNYLSTFQTHDRRTINEQECHLLKPLLDLKILLAAGEEPLDSFVNWFLLRPLDCTAIVCEDDGCCRLDYLDQQEKLFARSPSDYPPVNSHRLTKKELQLLEMADRHCRLEEAVAGGLSQSIYKLSAMDIQAVKISPDIALVDDYRSGANRVLSSLRRSTFTPVLSLDQSDDVAWQFDWVEPTITHTLRQPQQCLGKRTLGEKLRELLIPSGSDDLTVVEIGGGTGSFAQSFLGFVGQGRNVRYHIIEASHEMAEYQKRRVEKQHQEVEIHILNIETDSVPDLGADLVIANEMIADLQVVAKDNEEQADSDNHLVHKGLDTFFRNVGTLLARSGRFYLSEYGSPDKPPEVVNHLNHYEWSIDFRQVLQAAKQHGFVSELTPMKEFLQIDLSTPVMVGEQEHLYVLQNSLDLPLDYKLYDQSELEELICESKILMGPRYLPMQHGAHYGPDINQFFVVTGTMTDG